MTRSLVPCLTLAALIAGCSPNSSTNGSTIEPGARSASTADAGRGGRGGPGGRGGRGGDQALLRGITLSADQQQRIDAIRTRYRTQMEEQRQQSGAGADRDAARAQMRTVMEKQRGEIRAVLTVDQQQQFDRNVTEMPTRGERGGDRPPQ